jgi:hypothetical protein
MEFGVPKPQSSQFELSEWFSSVSFSRRVEEKALTSLLAAGEESPLSTGLSSYAGSVGDRLRISKLF